jgi:hypothetical protein
MIGSGLILATSKRPMHISPEALALSRQPPGLRLSSGRLSPYSAEMAALAGIDIAGAEISGAARPRISAAALAIPTRAASTCSRSSGADKRRRAL